MSRVRLDRFITSCAIILGLVGLGPIEGRAQPSSPADLGGIQRKMDALLRKELSQDWYPRAVDRERGGFHQTFARDWSPLCPITTRSWCTRPG